jgi:[ribosomal protein S5]-alanine N-acetyltransferase
MNDLGKAYPWGDQLPALHGNRVSLRWLEAADQPALFTIFSDPEVMRYWSSPPMRRYAESARLLDEVRTCFQTRQLFQWGIELRECSAIIGTITLFHGSQAHRRAEVGYALSRDRWGKGLASEALGLLIGFAFEELDLHRLEADVDPRNERSLRVLERQGFRREGVMRERYHVSGEISDAVFLGLVRREWTGGTLEPAVR